MPETPLEDLPTQTLPPEIPRSKDLPKKTATVGNPRAFLTLVGGFVDFLFLFSLLECLSQLPKFKPPTCWSRSLTGIREKTVISAEGGPFGAEDTKRKGPSLAKCAFCSQKKNHSGSTAGCLDMFHDS